MDILSVVKMFFLCLGATFFYSLIMNAPKKAIPFACVIGSAGYVIFELITEIGNKTLAFFLATLLIAAGGEILARVIKIPSTMFIIPAIVPLVPGYGLYQTMLYLVLDEKTKALDILIETIFAAGAMAIAIAVVSFAAKSFFSRTKKYFAANKK